MKWEVIQRISICNLSLYEQIGESEQNIILWMDHRAAAEAATINDTEHPILDFVGGKVSLEMECPKLLWLKNHLPETWFRIGKAFDLPDFLTWKATLDETRLFIVN